MRSLLKEKERHLSLSKNITPEGLNQMHNQVIFINDDESIIAIILIMSSWSVQITREKI